MPSPHCCGVDKLFNEKSARKQLKRYRKKGPLKPTSVLIEAIKGKGISGCSILDIGGGIGAIQLELLKAGATSAISVDASHGYLKIAKEEAENQNLSDKIEQQFGDFTEVAETIEQHSIVTLDKVICCYPDIDKLLALSLEKCSKYYGLVFPKGGAIAKLFAGFANLFFKITRNSFRTFIHPPEFVHQTITANGFVKVFHHTTFVWHVVLYEKK
ncbi:MAG: hypothetical protein COC01_07740 [Bacteroidetes bacterium]|nr:class I SAM-dependent methyltransferase [Bacteroidales bacterium AH-315-I05]PCH66566.1 MAG: hypothetical protein COC01_07740 [Bacteroidota bacterium]